VSALETTGMTLDLDELGLRQVNRTLQHAAHGESFSIHNPGGLHAIAAGLRAEVTVDVLGHAGYYCAGMNQAATVRVHGNVGVGVAENMMSGRIEVSGSAGQAAAATAHGGLLVVHGDAAARCAISLKGADVVVRGSVGHASAFMAQTGRLVVLGDAGAGLGDSIYEARLYVRGAVRDLGADCVEKPMRDEHKQALHAVLERAGFDGQVDPGEFKRYGSARKLYNFHIDNLGSY
jgi:methylamine---glutamate N-methyltransferase subunit B